MQVDINEILEGKRETEKRYYVTVIASGGAFRLYEPNTANDILVAAQKFVTYEEDEVWDPSEYVIYAGNFIISPNSSIRGFPSGTRFKVVKYGTLA